MKKFYSFVPFDTELALEDESELIEVEMLRIGKFDHPVHGELDINEELLQSLVNNFQANVLKRDVSFDWNHNQKDASAWLKDLDIIDGVLVGSVKFTPKGKESVDNEEYGYFSVEFLDNYTDAETGEEFGPTLTGGALTNRPFITNLKKIEFECPDVDGQLYRLEEKRMDKKKVKRTPAIAAEEEPKTLEEVLAEKKALEEEIVGLKKQLEENDDPSNKLEEVLGVVKTLEEANKKLTATVESLQEDKKKSDSKSRKLEVEVKCKKYIDEDGHHPSVIAVAKEIMLASSPDKKIIKLSETVKDGEEEKTIERELTVDDAVGKMLEAIPKSQRANYDERTTTQLGEEIEAEAEKKGIERAFAKHKISSKKMAA